MNEARETLKPKGKVEIFVTRGRPKVEPGNLLFKNPHTGQKIYDSAEISFEGVEILHKDEFMNIIMNQGKDRIINSLTTGFVRTIARMAIGDRGTLPSDSTSPKVPTADRTELFHETHRDDIDTTVLNIGTPGTHEVKFIKTFAAADIPITAFSNQANPVVNEVGLIMADLLAGNPLPRAPVSSPDAPDADEELFAMRAFKSVPFEAANEIEVTIRYTIFIE